MPIAQLLAIALAFFTFESSISTNGAMSTQAPYSQKNVITGYLDVAGSTVTLYMTKAAFKYKDRSMCIDATIFPMKRIRTVAAYRGKKVTAYGYVVTKIFYLGQQGNDIDKGSSPIQSLCRNSNVMTITKLTN